jgi:outer membrane receptor protein involved in Fe transport
VFKKPLFVILPGFFMLPLQAHAGEIPTVTVTASKEPVIRKLDRTVHDVSAMPKAANGTAQEVLQSIPELSVTADGQIAVKGNPQVTVLVDGKPVAALSGDERAVALQTMSGADIASVDVITNPSAAYQANGGAIVNIVLKRHRKQGAQAQLRGSVADRGLWNAGVSGDAAGRRLGVHGSVALRHDGTLKTRRSEAGWNDPASGRSGQTLQASQVFVRRVVESAALGADADLGDAGSFSLSARHDARRSRPLLDTLNVIRGAEGDATYHRVSYGPNEQSDGSVSLAYSRQGAGTAFKATVQRSDTTTLVDKSFRDVYVEPERDTAYGRGATRSARRLGQATLDWSRKSERGQWGMGLDLQDEANGLRNDQAAVDPSTGGETPDPLTTNGYALATTLSAAYLTRQAGRGPWEVLLGGRVERMALRVHPAQGAMQRSRWRSFNPSLHVNHALGEQAVLTLAYRRSLQRPDPRDLNPFATYVDAQNLNRGNPGLGPQRLASWEIGANMSTARLDGTLGVFHRNSRDTVADARSITDDVIVTSKRNGGRARSTGVTGSLDWKPDARLKLGVDGGIHRVALDTPGFDGTVRQRAIAGYVNARAGYSAGDDELSLDAHVQSAGITPLVRTGATSSVNASWKRRLNATLSLTVNATDLFDGSRRTYRTETDTFRQLASDHFVARRLYVGFVARIDRAGRY